LGLAAGKISKEIDYCLLLLNRGIATKHQPNPQAQDLEREITKEELYEHLVGLRNHASVGYDMIMAEVWKSCLDTRGCDDPNLSPFTTSIARTHHNTVPELTNMSITTTSLCI
jgi:hypothetical protein